MCVFPFQARERLFIACTVDVEESEMDGWGCWLNGSVEGFVHKLKDYGIKLCLL